jgi:hypothetical protein
MNRSHNPVRSARRRVEAQAQHAGDDICCLYCGNTDHLVVRPRRIEDHHTFGRKRDSHMTLVCLNCHAVAHEHLRDADVSMTSEQEPTKFARAIFCALAVHFSLLAQACWRFAKKMEKKHDS